MCERVWGHVIILKDTLFAVKQGFEARILAQLWVWVSSL
jgi:hypothetical protein